MADDEGERMVAAAVTGLIAALEMRTAITALLIAEMTAGREAEVERQKRVAIGIAVAPLDTAITVIVTAAAEDEGRLAVRAAAQVIAAAIIAPVALLVRRRRAVGTAGTIYCEMDRKAGVMAGELRCLLRHTATRGSRCMTAGVMLLTEAVLRGAIAEAFSDEGGAGWLAGVRRR